MAELLLHTTMVSIYQFEDSWYVIVQFFIITLCTWIYGF